MIFSPPYFVSHKPHKAELAVETLPGPGDMTAHDGRLWHRVARIQKAGTQRRSLFVPCMTGEPIIRQQYIA